VDAYHIQKKMPGSATGAAGFPQEDFALLMTPKRSICKEIARPLEGWISIPTLAGCPNNATKMHGVLACE
jgi:hypothetical protein